MLSFIRLARVTPIISRQRQVTLPGCAQLREQSLINCNVATPKSVCGPSDVETPGAVGHIVNERKCFSLVRIQPTQPMSECEHIMFAQIFHITNLESGGFCGVKQSRQRRNIA